MIQLTMDFSPETILCKRHYARYEVELRMDFKMLTIVSEEPDAYMYSQNTGPCTGMPLRRYQQTVTGVQRIRQIFQTDGELKRLHEEIAAKLGIEGGILFYF